MTYRVGLIGAGATGQAHARHWNAAAGAEIVGVLDLRAEAARAIGLEFGDWNTLLSQAKPDIIDICTPPLFHQDYAERAAAAGKAVFVETPLAPDLAGCDALIAAVERAGVPAMPGHILRYVPEYAAAKRLVDAGGVGRPAAIRTARLAGDAAPTENGGLILEMLGPDFDWLRWTFGPVTRVFAKGFFGRPELLGRLEYALVTLRFASGAVGHVTGSWVHPGGCRTTLEIAGDGGMLEYDSARTAPLTASLKTAVGGGAVLESPIAPGEDPAFLEIAAFVSALQKGEAPPVTLHEAREAARIALAALESLTTGQVVTLI